MDQILIDNGKTRLTLDELGLSQPGMARLMAEVGPRMHKAYYAAKAGNWPLANYMLSEARKIFEVAAVVRPKYDASIEEFLAAEYAAVRTAVADRDWAAFDGAFAAMVERSHAYHDLYNKPFIRWKLPDTPPADLDLISR